MNNVSTSKNREKDIRQEEDSLFKQWASKRHPFANDGCADPKMFLESHKKIVFVLKERNWGHTLEEQRELQIKGCAEIVEEREIFNSWWTLMAQWADVILPKQNTYESWHQIQSSFMPSSELNAEEREKWIKERNKESLGKCACIQLKKAPGGGELNKDDFFTVVKEDKDLLLRQFAIYTPHFIVSCGSNDNWSVFTRILFENHKINQTSNGINYFIIQLDNNNHKTAVINFGHPSMRVNSALWGALAFGLREAITEIFPQLISA
jgi:hypothetical protein